MIEIPYQPLDDSGCINGVEFEFNWYCAKSKIADMLWQMQRKHGAKPIVYMIKPMPLCDVFGECVSIIATSGTL